MTRQGRSSGTSTTGTEQRTLVSQATRVLVDPWLDQLYYRLDLRQAPTNGDPKGHPDHSKVLSTIAFFFGLVGLAYFGTIVVRGCGAVERLALLIGKNAITLDPAVLGVLLKSCSIMTAALLAYAGLVFAMAFGLAGFRTWAKTRGGGTSDTLAQVGVAASFDSLAAQALSRVSPEGRERDDV